MPFIWILRDVHCRFESVFGANVVLSRVNIKFNMHHQSGMRVESALVPRSFAARLTTRSARPMFCQLPPWRTDVRCQTLLQGQSAERPGLAWAGEGIGASSFRRSPFVGGGVHLPQGVVATAGIERPLRRSQNVIWLRSGLQANCGVSRLGHPDGRASHDERSIADPQAGCQRAPRASNSRECLSFWCCCCCCWYW